jgi:hypothetical protein
MTATKPVFLTVEQGRADSAPTAGGRNARRWRRPAANRAAARRRLIPSVPLSITENVVPSRFSGTVYVA